MKLNAPPEVSGCLHTVLIIFLVLLGAGVLFFAVCFAMISGIRVGP
jgi:hypothetical protein